MRLWSFHPCYLDRKGLLALWREGLLARAVLRGQTRGYRHHPQLQRFREWYSPLKAIDAYLFGVFIEAGERGYRFSREKLDDVLCLRSIISVTRGQMSFEREHLINKLSVRAPDCIERLPAELQPHPLFHVVEGAVESWERT